MPALAHARLLVRSASWTFVLPLLGTVLLGLSHPLIAFFIVLGFAYGPGEMLGFIYSVGWVPSALTITLFVLSRRRFGNARSLALACAVAAAAAVLWWLLLAWHGWPASHLPPSWLVRMAIIAAIATSLLGLDARLVPSREA